MTGIPVSLGTGRPGVVLRDFAWSHPGWWIILLSAGAWSVLLLLDPADSHGHGAHASAAAASPWHAPLMAVAMMAPLALPGARYVALTSLWERRRRAQGLFLAGYLGVWTLGGLAIGAVVGVAQAWPGRSLTAALLCAAAALWQFTPVKRRALRRCARTVPIPPRGGRADAACVGFGVRTALSCAATCAWAMAAVAATGHSLPVALALLAVLLHERIARDYAPRTGAVAVTALGLAALLGLPL